MTIQSGSSRGLAYGVQSARGTAATTTKLLRTANNGQDFKNNRNNLESASLREDGQPTIGASGTYSTSATIPVNFAYGDYNDFIAAALRQAPSAWPVSAPFDLTFGSTLTYFTFEDRLKDITQYGKYIDMVLNTFKLTAAQSDNGAYVTGSFDFIGTTRSFSGTQIAAPSAAGTTMPFTGCGGVVSVGGTPIGVATSFDFSIDNGLKNIFVLGNCGAYDIAKGPIKVSGNLTVFLDGLTYINDVDNQTLLDLKLVLTDVDSNTTTFEFPSCRLTSDTLGGGTGDMTVALPFEAYYDSTATTTVKASHS